MKTKENFKRLYNLRITIKYGFQCGDISKKTKEHQLDRLNKLMSIYI
jgi:hypothetical protein